MVFIATLALLNKAPPAPAAPLTSSSMEWHSVEHILEKHLPPKELAQVTGALFGFNQGKLVEELP